jgi:hypothetical protein
LLLNSLDPLLIVIELVIQPSIIALVLLNQLLDVKVSLLFLLIFFSYFGTLLWFLKNFGSRCW